jgi:predicted MarR family transcription regulator
LGELTDELEEYGEGSYLTEFVSAGPKNYSYKVYSTRDKRIHEIVKVKGICLDYTTVKHINARAMKRKVHAFVKGGNEEETSVVSWKIRRLSDHKIVTRAERKKYRVVYDKRIVLRDFTTHPYGYN